MTFQGKDYRLLRLGLACSMLSACLFMTSGCSRSYLCESGKTIAVREQVAGDRAIIDVGDGDITLPRVPGASGAKFSDGRRTVSFQGDELTVEADGKNLYGRCVLIK